MSSQAERFAENMRQRDLEAARVHVEMLEEREFRLREEIQAARRRLWELEHGDEAK